MITIYALINPFTGNPFYIGRSTEPVARLTMHSSDFMRRCGKPKPYTIKRDNLIKLIRECGLTVESRTLLVCPIKAGAKCEQHIYHLTVSMGYKLLQRKNCGK